MVTCCAVCCDWLPSLSAFTGCFRGLGLCVRCPSVWQRQVGSYGPSNSQGHQLFGLSLHEKDPSQIFDSDGPETPRIQMNFNKMINQGSSLKKTKLQQQYIDPRCLMQDPSAHTCRRWKEGRESIDQLAPGNKGPEKYRLSTCSVHNILTNRMHWFPSRCVTSQYFHELSINCW